MRRYLTRPLIVTIRPRYLTHFVMNKIFTKPNNIVLRVSYFSPQFCSMFHSLTFLMIFCIHGCNLLSFLTLSVLQQTERYPHTPTSNLQGQNLISEFSSPRTTFVTVMDPGLPANLLLRYLSLSL